MPVMNPVVGPVMGAPMIGIVDYIGMSVEQETIDWAGAVRSNGGNVSSDRRAVVNAFILAEKAAGLWTLTDDYWGLWGEDAAQALTSLKRRALATATAIFEADRGYTGDGVATFVDTGFAPGVSAVASTFNNFGLGVYVRTNVTSSSASAAGVQSTTNRILRIIPRDSGNASLSGNSSTGTFTLPAADSRGYTTVQRNGDATTVLGYKNGALMTRTATPANVGASFPPTPSLYFGANNNAGVAANFYTGQIAFGRFGAALTAAQELTHYNNVQAWATTIGAQV